MMNFDHLADYYGPIAQEMCTAPRMTFAQFVEQTPSSALRWLMERAEQLSAREVAYENRMARSDDIIAMWSFTGRIPSRMIEQLNRWFLDHPGAHFDINRYAVGAFDLTLTFDGRTAYLEIMQTTEE